MTISVIVPCYNEEESIPLFYEAMEIIRQQMQEEFEYIFIDDGSKDTTLATLRNLHKNDASVKYYSFSRNFGKEAALYAGLKKATGDLITVMDVDLQDPPEMLIRMKELLDKDGDLDCVGCARTTRHGEPPIRSFFAKLFYKLINRISNIEVVDGARDFRLMKRQMVNAILEVTEYNRFSKGIFTWVGFRTTYLPYENVERVAGQTSWNFWSLLSYSLEGIVNFSDVPLKISSYVGLISCCLSFMMIGFVVVRHVLFGNPVSGWASTVSLILFMGGLQLFSVGILGRYISKIFMETKKRPLYLIKEASSEEAIG